MALAQLASQPLHVVVAVDPSIASHLGAICSVELLVEPVGNGRSSGHFQPHKLYASAVELLFGGEKIAGVGPQRSLVEGGHEGAGRAVESRYPFAPSPAVGNILAVMGIGRGKDEGRQVFAAHHLAQTLNTISYGFFLHSIFLFYNQFIPN